jgi:hypothetical protein
MAEHCRCGPQKTPTKMPIPYRLISIRLALHYLRVAASADFCVTTPNVRNAWHFLLVLILKPE